MAVIKRERDFIVHTYINEAVECLLQVLGTSFGPFGLDKMLIKDKEALVTNDGATILKFYQDHPIHKILSQVSKSQDTNCGDGTTSVILLSCCLIRELLELRLKGMPPSILTQGLSIAKKIATDYVNSIKLPISPEDYRGVAMTTLSSKIASNVIEMGDIAVKAVKEHKFSDIKIVKVCKGSISDIKMYNSLLLEKKFSLGEVDTLKVLLIQFPISAPKPNMDYSVEITSKDEMEQFVRAERDHVLSIINSIKETGANLILVQKSLLRESLSDIAKHYLESSGIFFISNIDRPIIADLSAKLKIKPISDVELLSEPKTISVGEVDDFLEIKGYGCSIVVKGCDSIVCDEAERNLFDALSVVNCLHKDPFILPGGCAVEAGISVKLSGYTGPLSTTVHKIAKAFISLPHFIASNTGLYSVDTVNKLEKMVSEHQNLGLSVRQQELADMIVEDRVIQPAYLNLSMINLAFESTEVIINIDDFLPSSI